MNQSCSPLSESPSARNNSTKVMGALALVQVLFGINFITSKVIIQVFPPLAWANFRVFISAIALLGIAIATGKPHPPFKKEFFAPLCLYSFLGIVVSQSSFLMGLHYTTPTNGAILTTLIPIFTLLLATLSGQEPLFKSRIFGFFFALTGVLIIRRIETFTISDQSILGDGLILLNCFSYSLFLLVSKKFLGKYPPLWTTTWFFIIGSLELAIVAAPTWIGFKWPSMNSSLLACMLFSIFGSTLLAYFLNLWALSRTRSSLVALFIYLQPVIASLLSWILFGEIISSRTLLSSLLIFTGMILASTRKKVAAT